MSETSKHSLRQSLLRAISLYDEVLNEEQGGFIVKKPGVEHYEFIPIRNQNTGTSEARALYIAEPSEFNDKISEPILDDVWEMHASYHTHPLGSRAMPSHRDLTELFTSFPINYIYAPGKELNKFTYILPKNSPNPLRLPEWSYENIMTFSGFNPGFPK